MTRIPSRGRLRPPSPFRPAPALLGVGSLLLCACPTWAQSLSVTVGTATVSGTGTAVSAGGSATFGGGAGPGTSSYQTGTVFGGFASLNLQNGGSFQGILTEQGGRVSVSGGTAGTVADQAGINSDTDVINISGGTVTTVTNDHGSVGITGGTIQSVGSDDPNVSGQITISGGNIQSVATPGNLTVSGGILGSASDGSSGILGGVGISGGTIQTLTVQGGSGTISGGSISTLNNGSPNTQISGGGFQFITNGGIINILGTGLQEIGTPTDANNDGVFQLLGLLSDGEVLNAQYKQTRGSLEFNGVKATPLPVPEASTIASLGGMLLLGGAGLAFRARRRAEA